jgi:hypothetical protein
VNQLPENAGHSCGSAYQMMKSCRSVGVARNSQLYVHATARTQRRCEKFPSATKKPMMIAAASDAAVSSNASSAPLQYGPEESAAQNRCESKLASNYFTVEAGIWYFPAIFASVPFDLSFLRPAEICVPTSSPLRK